MRLKPLVFLVSVVLVSSSALAQNQLLMTGLDNRGDNISIFEFRDTSFELVWSWNAGSGVYPPGGRLGDMNNDGIADVALTRFVSVPAPKNKPALKQAFVDVLQAGGLQATASGSGTSSPPPSSRPMGSHTSEGWVTSTATG